MKEIWKPIILPKIFKDYEISNMGRIKSYKSNKPKILKVGITKDGYNFIGLSYNNKKFTCSVHRLVAYNFIPNSDLTKTTVNHKDGNKTNNKCTNLEWLSPLDNMIHAFDTNLRKNQKLISPQEINDIQKLSNKNTSSWKIGKILNIPPSTVQRTRKKYNFPLFEKEEKFDLTLLNEFENLCNNNFSTSDIAKHFKIKESLARSIRRKYNFKSSPLGIKYSNINEEEINNIKKLLLEGYNIAEISRKLNRHDGSIRKLCHRLKLV